MWLPLNERAGVSGGIKIIGHKMPLCIDYMERVPEPRCPVHGVDHGPGGPNIYGSCPPVAPEPPRRSLCFYYSNHGNYWRG